MIKIIKQSRVMESGNHFKNKVSSKNQKSRGTLLLVIVLIIVIFNSCKKEDEYSYIEDYYMEKSTLTLKGGEQEELYIGSSSGIMPSGDGTSWNWESSNNSVAFLTDGGGLNTKYVYAAGKGTATITCTISSENGKVSKTVSCNITVM